MIRAMVARGLRITSRCRFPGAMRILPGLMMSPSAASFTSSGQIRFRLLANSSVNPAGLKSIGNNLYQQSGSSGEAVVGIPNTEGFGSIAQGFTEMANVKVVEEMVNMIVAQRAYEANSKTIQTSDSMLQIANNLKK